MSANKPNTARQQAMPDLNGVRDLMFKAQRSGAANRKEPKDKLFVDSAGGIRQGAEVGAADAQRLSEVQQDEFRALISKGTSRLSRDREVVRHKLPSGAREVKSPEGITGWIYEVECELGNRYTMFVYFDGGNYQVQVLKPQLEQKWQSAHTGHIFADGHICMGDGFGSGRPSLESAYAKSCIWATGISIALVTGSFPFNINQ